MTDGLRTSALDMFVPLRKAFEPDSPDSGKPLLVDVCQGLGIYGRVSPDVSAVSRVPVSVGQQPLLET